MSNIIRHIPTTKSAIMQLAEQVAGELTTDIVERIAEIEAMTMYLEQLRKNLEPELIRQMEAGETLQAQSGIKVSCYAGREDWDFTGNLTWIDLQGKLTMAKDQVKVIQGEIDALEGYLKRQYHSQLADTSTGEVMQKPKFNGCGKPSIRITIPAK